MTLLDQTISRIVPQDDSFRGLAKNRLSQLTMPYWALGRLMDLAVDLAGITRSVTPPIDRRAIVTMAADHGVAAEAVSKYPQEVTCQMVFNFLNRGAGINALARVGKAQVIVVNMGVAGDLGDLKETDTFKSRPVGRGTANMAAGPAMTRDQAIQSLEIGIGLAQELGESVDILGTGEMGIGNTTPSSAIVAALTGAPAGTVTGRGTGIDEEQFNHKVSVIQRSLDVNRPDTSDPLDVLSKIGGFEIGGLAGLILGAAAMGKPVVIDGFISTAAALIAHSLAPNSAQYMVAAHRSVEQGHSIALEHLGKKPLLDLDLRLGEGTGAAIAMTLVEAAVRILTEVATFEEAAVSQADK